jgi:hypothetical protein
MISALALVAGPAACAPAGAVDTPPTGTFKLVGLDPFNEVELFLFDFTEQAGRVRGTVRDSMPFQNPPQVMRVATRNGVLTVSIEIGNTDALFRGKPATGGAYTGLLTVKDVTIPARLEPTKAERVARKGREVPPLLKEYAEASEDKDLKSRVAKLRALAAKKPGDPTLRVVYAELLENAEVIGLSEPDARQLARQWIDGASPYGDRYAAEIRTDALKALSGKKPFAPLALALASEAEKDIPADAPPEIRGKVLKALALAARQSGKADVAAQAEQRAAKVEAQLDEKFQEQIRPYLPKPEPSAAKDRKPERVALLELFTGAECPPCVAADLVFDALNETYSPREIASLQYHEHVPGPDPLTSPDSEKRAEYYPDLSGTPSVYLDGQSVAINGGPGGPLQAARMRYNEYRPAVERALAKPAGATIDLKANRDGDTVTITATAEAKPGAGGDAAKLRLRLALVEEKVRYQGGNGMRFHHHIVRAMPGGPDGQELRGGRGKAEVTVKLGELRQTLEKYLETSANENGSFPEVPPPIELGKLAVVAFVQDDGDRSVLDAAMVPLKEGK